MPAYPWKSTRIQDLPDINNNDEFHIPLFPEVKHGSGRYHGDSFRHSVAVGHFSEHHEKPIPKRTSIHNKPGCITGELSGKKKNTIAHTPCVGRGSVTRTFEDTLLGKRRMKRNPVWGATLSPVSFRLLKCLQTYSRFWLFQIGSGLCDWLI